MITFLLLDALINVVSALLSWLPVVTSLPFGLDGYLSTGIGFFRDIFSVFPFLSTVLTVALAYLGFRLSLMGVKAVMGNRTPSHNH